MNPIQYEFLPQNFNDSDPNHYQLADLKSEEMLISLGPQHPSTHGVLRIQLKLDGEMVVFAEPVIGYLHTGIEKECESRTYLQVFTLIDPFFCRFEKINQRVSGCGVSFWNFLSLFTSSISYFLTKMK